MITLLKRTVTSRHLLPFRVPAFLSPSQYPTGRRAMPGAVYSTASLEESHAQPYQSMTGKLNVSLLRALDVMGFQYMTPVQSKVLTELPTFRTDCLVQAKTGTGKTVAFLLPALHSLLTGPPLQRGNVGILIVSPTRELALQIAKECDQLTSQLPRPLECHTAFGGTARASNYQKFMKGAPAILVATPGRLKDYLSETSTGPKFREIQTVILDEADTMLESGFLADVTAILKLLPPKQKGWQGMCFSATVPEKIKNVISCILKPGYATISTIDKNESITISSLPQYHIIIPSPTETFVSLMSLLDEEVTPKSKIIIFGVTANMIALFAKVYARQTNLKVYELHSRLNQNVRTKTTEEFKTATSGIMFASDVIGRGMDFPNVDLVIQIGLPSNAEQYVHRVGRTARAGNEGRAIIMLTQNESYFLRQNPKLPILPHEKSDHITDRTSSYAKKIEQAMHAIDEDTKRKAYSSYLGYLAGSGLMKPLRLDKTGLVRLSNDLAVQGMHCPEPPAMEKSTIGKMGLKGVPGIRYATASEANSMHRPPRKHHQDGDEDTFTKKPRPAPSRSSRGQEDEDSPPKRPRRAPQNGSFNPRGNFRKGPLDTNRLT